MFFRNHRRWRLMAAILSLSLLTVMAGAAVAPALGVISAYFSDEPEILVKLIISMWSSVKFSDKIFESILPWLRSPLM